MNATRAKNLIVGVFSDLQVNPTILASLIYGSMKDDVMVRFHDFMLELISLWAGPNNESEKTAHVYRWARNVNPYKEG